MHTTSFHVLQAISEPGSAVARNGCACLADHIELELRSIRSSTAFVSPFWQACRLSSICLRRRSALTFEQRLWDLSPLFHAVNRPMPSLADFSEIIELCPMTWVSSIHDQGDLFPRSSGAKSLLLLITSHSPLNVGKFLQMQLSSFAVTVLRRLGGWRLA
jgi:hypothetical protein